MNRPVTTLFLLTSVDGKISTGASDELDVDKDYPQIDGLKEGLHQYYEIEQTTDLWSLNSGRVMAKIGVNDKEMPGRSPVSFVIVDNSHLDEHGVKYFCSLTECFVLVTSNRNHPAFGVNSRNIHIIYQDKIIFKDVFTELYNRYGCKRLTLQSGGTLNEIFLREKLIDYVDIVVAPVLIGGKETSSLIDGKSITTTEELNKLGVLRLEECKTLEDSYLRLKYKIIS